MNQATICGHLGADPNIHTFQDGEMVANFSVATTETWKDGNGEKKELTEWHRVVVRGSNRIKAYIEPYFRKGGRVLVQGRIQTRVWTDENGIERQTKEIIVGKLGMCDLVDRKGNSTRNDPPPPVRDDLDDEIPF